MATVAILGAGYMGSALTFPLADNGTRVHLWGTWLDDTIIDASREREHPKLKRRLPGDVRLFYSGELAQAIGEADVIVVAVTSEGFLPVFQRFLEEAPKPFPLITVTKGFVLYGGSVVRISEAAAALFRRKFPTAKFQWISVGGPVKAVELSQLVPSATIFALNSSSVHEITDLFHTGYYRVQTTDDITGVELSSAFKNIYSIALGIHDGLYGAIKDRIFHNLKSLLFNQSVREMALIVEAAGGRGETVFDLAGIGDLYVTSSSGRNRRLGDLIGQGFTAQEAYEHMCREGEIAEGYHTLDLGVSYLEKCDGELLRKLPLLRMLHWIIIEGRNCKEGIDAFLKTYMII